MKFVIRVFKTGLGFVQPRKISASQKGVDFSAGKFTMRVPLRYSPFEAKNGIAVTAQDWPDAYTCLAMSIGRTAVWRPVENAYETDSGLLIWMEEKK